MAHAEAALSSRSPPPFETRSAGSPYRLLRKRNPVSPPSQPPWRRPAARPPRLPFRVAQDGGAPPFGFRSNGARQSRAPPTGTAGLRQAEAELRAERRTGRPWPLPLGVGGAHGGRGRAGEVRGGGLREPGTARGRAELPPATLQLKGRIFRSGGGEALARLPAEPWCPIPGGVQSEPIP